MSGRCAPVMAAGAADWVFMRVPAEARVDLDAIGDNIGLLRERAGGRRG